ncbi:MULTISPECIES: DUF5334 family protein [unclassified Desulfovibrio]|mgnify:FL=1|uniref:DUF5334 family protein n=1 Tax=unclassified Desulfovibrio TaxID=2593640 RepID=UPI000F5DEC1F|nr:MULTISPECIES: DUF5334 family protein [unclassified Desulfovibrio]RRD72296.1 hypothetical protein EII24_00020 [Desulfovibrio sp. OH1209_COT-279]RRD88407.1 hypothetical protein EII23_00020 [Desulfovibrio sp. OH1186_COT-070]
MKYLPLFFGTALFLLCPPWTSLAWDGFDAESADLIEVSPDRVPSRGDTVDVRSHDTEATQTCLVESVIRNKKTVELVVRTPSGAVRTLVMEGR